MQNNREIYGDEGQFRTARNYDGEFTNNARPDFQGIPLSLDELKVLKECQRTAVLYRGIPFSFLATAGYYYMLKNKIIKGMKFGPAISGAMGFFVGVLSFRRNCIEKILTLPDSSILKRKILIAQGKQPYDNVVQSDDRQMWFDTTPTSEPNMTSSFDIEPDNRSDQFNDYSIKPLDTDSHAINPPLQPNANRPYTTYEDLRRANREQYEKAKSASPRSRETTNRAQQYPTYSESSPDRKLNEPTIPPRKSDDFW